MTEEKVPDYSKRTKGEWKISEYIDNQETLFEIVDENVDQIAESLTKPDAAFICHAVNNHDELVKMLESLVEANEQTSGGIPNWSNRWDEAKELLERVK